MGLIRGSATFTRFFVEGRLPGNHLEAFTAGITRFSFRNLDEHSDEERSTGWVSIMDMFARDFEDRNFFMHPYIALSFRVDVRKVPRNALRQACLEAENEIKQTEDLEYLPKEKRKDLKDFIWRQLLRRAIPRTNTYDMIWNLDTSLLLFASTNSKLGDEFAEVFSRTFGMTLVPVFPYSLAGRHLEKQGTNPEVLDALRASDFVGEAK